jgi:UDP-N-acetylglucosamine 2-epimerase (non-hydrolysing)
LRRQARRFRAAVLVTGQHRHMLDQVLRLFGIRPDVDLNVMRPGQSLGDVTVRALAGVERVLGRLKPDIVLVQGDATSAFVGALAAYYRQIPVGHVEAGLRTHDKYAPFPEEGNRKFVTAIADLHFAPTAGAARNLRREGVPAERVFVTGNTVVDALRMIRARRERRPVPVEVKPGRRLILVTGHRRESFGPAFRAICRALARIADRNPDVEIVYPVHLNPNVRGPVFDVLAGRERIHLLEPLEYLPFVRLMERADLILTDSGGIQEEAPSLHKPVLVMRDATERPEAVEAGAARLVGTDERAIVSNTEELLRSPAAYRRMERAPNPFGDGRAARRIVLELRRFPGR